MSSSKIKIGIISLSILFANISFIQDALSQTNVQNNNSAQKINFTDTLASFKYIIDKEALTVYTNRDSEEQKDSSTYNAIQEKPRFYKNFESGRIGAIKYCVTDTLLLSYEIYTEKDPDNPIDILAPSSRWFYFLMTGVKGKEVAIKMVGSDAVAPVYSYDNINWQRYSYNDEATKDYRITKKYTRDSVYIAYYVPYTNKHLKEKIEDWQYRNGVRVFSLGESHLGKEMNMLVVTNDYVPDKEKKRVYIHARVHPSETPCSWALEGLIDYLTGTSQQAIEMRNKTVFFILPFSNPDGVELGYSRCDAIGVNMEINYDQPDSLTRPEVKNIKKFINTTTYGNNHLDMILNFHSQISPNFTYWIHTEKSTSKKYYQKELTFAVLTTDDNHYADKKHLSFSDVAPRYIEGYIWDRAKEKTIALTHETPYSYYNKDESGQWVTIDNLKEIGIKTLYSIFEYLNISTSERIVIHPQSEKKLITKNDDDHLYLGEKYFEAKKNNVKVKYKYDNLKKGNYLIYRWIVGEVQPLEREDENCWELIGGHNQKNNGTFEYDWVVNKGDKINAIRLVKKED